MREIAAGHPYPFEGGRLKAANIEMVRYLNGQRKISSLERDDRLSQDAARTCAHCGTEAGPFQFDHLIPQSKLAGASLLLNQVRSCGVCNAGRGAKDLMTWHRANATFPTLSVLRRYLKLCYFYADTRCVLDQPAIVAGQNGLPFEPLSFPRKFPPVGQLVWDFGFIGQV